MQIKERRAFLRLPFSVEVRCGPVSEAERDTSGRGQNVSLGGVRAVLLERYEEGTMVRVRFSFPCIDDEVEATGQVVRVAAYTIGEDVAYDTGIEFVQISEDSRRLVDQWIESHPVAQASVGDDVPAGIAD